MHFPGADTGTVFIQSASKSVFSFTVQIVPNQSDIIHILSIKRCRFVCAVHALHSLKLFFIYQTTLAKNQSKLLLPDKTLISGFVH